MTPGGRHRPAEHAWAPELVQAVSSLPAARRLWLAYSGGLDSSLLLHALAECLPPHRREQLRAVHINHQLQANAAACEAACRQTCQDLDIPLTVEAVTLARPEAGAITGLEAAAREARYGVFQQLLAPGDLLLMAHHDDDQAETLLFRFLRGSGVAGLAGMPLQRALGQGALYRPLLGFSRQQLRQWAMAAGLSWVEDPSNDDRRFDRNFLRHEILPRVRQRWPGLSARLAHTASQCREQAALADRLAQIQAAQCVDDQGRVRLEPLSALAEAEQQNLLRWWISEQGYLPPASRQLGADLAELLAAAPDRSPELRGPGYQVKRYRDHLHLVPASEGDVASDDEMVLQPHQPLLWAGGRLRLEAVGATPTSAPVLTVTRRRGGERIRPHPGGPSKPLKKWLQEQAVAPWDRTHLPLVREAGELVAVGDLWRSPRFAGEAPTSGWRVVWERDFD